DQACARRFEADEVGARSAQPIARVAKIPGEGVMPGGESSAGPAADDASARVEDEKPNPARLRERPLAARVGARPIGAGRGETKGRLLAPEGHVAARARAHDAAQIRDLLVIDTHFDVVGSRVDVVDAEVAGVVARAIDARVRAAREPEEDARVSDGRGSRSIGDRAAESSCNRGAGKQSEEKHEAHDTSGRHGGPILVGGSVGGLRKSLLQTSKASE